MEKTYLVKGENVEEKVEASSPKQAKLRAGFKIGLGGKRIGEFMRNKNIKVRRI